MGLKCLLKHHLLKYLFWLCFSLLSILTFICSALGPRGRKRKDVQTKNEECFSYFSMHWFNSKNFFVLFFLNPHTTDTKDYFVSFSFIFHLSFLYNELSQCFVSLWLQIRAASALLCSGFNLLLVWALIA